MGGDLGGAIFKRSGMDLMFISRSFSWMHQKPSFYLGLSWDMPCTLSGFPTLTPSNLVNNIEDEHHQASVWFQRRTNH